jgi:hypothetical protein
VAKTPLQELEDLFGGPGLPLFGPASGVAGLTTALQILNGVDDSKLDTLEMRIQFKNLPVGKPTGELKEVIEKAKGPSEAMASLIYYFVMRAIEAHDHE